MVFSAAILDSESKVNLFGDHFLNFMMVNNTEGLLERKALPCDMYNTEKKLSAI